MRPAAPPLPSRRWLIPAAVIAVALVARLAHLAVIRNHPFYDLHTLWEGSDMHQYVAWAGHLTGGDWLDEDTFRPYFRWQQGIASPGVWNSWYGAHVYYQPPLYTYLLAATLALTNSLDAFRVGQIVLGAINCALISLLGSRLHGAAAGWIAGLGAAVYAPFILYDGEILRGTVVMTTQLLLLLALARGHEGKEHRRWGRAAAWAGLAFGIAYLTDPAILLFAPMALLWVWWSAGQAGGGTTMRALRAPALFMAGILAALVPLMARNVAVGAPLFSSTTRGPLAFVMGNAPDARPAGVFIPPSTGSILGNAGYSMLGTIRGTLRLYNGHYAPLLAKQWQKARALWGSYEVPDNPSFYYAARVSPVVRFGLRFLPVAALGLVGLGLTLLPASRDPRYALLPLYLLAGNALFFLAHVVSRYRQPMVIALMILGSHAVMWAARRKGVAAAGVAAAAAVIIFVLPWRPPEGYGYTRTAEYVIAARVCAGRGQMDRAAAEMNEVIEIARADSLLKQHLPVLLYTLGTMQASADRHEEAIVSFRAALAEDPDYGEAARELTASERAVEFPSSQAVPR